MRKFFLFSFLLLIVVLPGCSSNKDKIGNMESNQTTYTYTVAWNGIVYGISDDVVTSDKLGKVIGNVKRLVSPIPERNGDSARTNPEGPKGPVSIGTKLFELKVVDQREAIAIETDSGRYVKAYKSGLLKS